MFNRIISLSENVDGLIESQKARLERLRSVELHANSKTVDALNGYINCTSASIRDSEKCQELYQELLGLEDLTPEYEVLRRNACSRIQRALSSYNCNMSTVQDACVKKLAAAIEVNRLDPSVITKIERMHAVQCSLVSILSMADKVEGILLEQEESLNRIDMNIAAAEAKIRQGAYQLSKKSDSIKNSYLMKAYRSGVFMNLWVAIIIVLKFGIRCFR